MEPTLEGEVTISDAALFRTRNCFHVRVRGVVISMVVLLQSDSLAWFNDDAKSLFAELVELLQVIDMEQLDTEVAKCQPKSAQTLAAAAAARATARSAVPGSQVMRKRKAPREGGDENRLKGRRLQCVYSLNDQPPVGSILELDGDGRDSGGYTSVPLARGRLEVRVYPFDPQRPHAPLPLAGRGTMGLISSYFTSRPEAANEAEEEEPIGDVAEAGRVAGQRRRITPPHQSGLDQREQNDIEKALALSLQESQH